MPLALHEHPLACLGKDFFSKGLKADVTMPRFGVQADFAVKHPFEDAPAVFGYINLAPQLPVSSRSPEIVLKKPQPNYSSEGGSARGFCGGRGGGGASGSCSEQIWAFWP